jgi:methionine synthase II (cobalamin-independent)
MTYVGQTAVRAALANLRAALHGRTADTFMVALGPGTFSLHFCWGSGQRPHENDIPLRDIIEIVLKARARWIAFKASNPRHEHEWQTWEQVKLPAGIGIMPGVAGYAAELIEHPELIAQRLSRFARLVGPESVMAGTNRGLATRAGVPTKLSRRELSQMAPSKT